MSITNDLIFFRHSLPVIDPTIPACEWHLSEEGRRRCKLLAEQLANFKPQRIISSQEPKALETAQIVAETLKLPSESAPGLNEHVRSQVKYSSQEAFEASACAFFEHPDQLVYGDETADRAYPRFATAVEAVRDLYPDQSPLIIVTHGTVIALFVARIFGVDPLYLWKNLKLPCIVEFSTKKPRNFSLESSSLLSSIPCPLSPIP